MGWDAFKQNPFLGSGPGTFRDIFSISNYARLFEREGGTNRRFAHNTYLEVLVGTGFMGLLIFFLILWRALRNFHLARRYFQLFNNEEMVSMIRAYQLSFISLLIYLLMFSNTYHKYLLLSFALSQVALRLSRNTPEGERLE